MRGECPISPHLFSYHILPRYAYPAHELPPHKGHPQATQSLPAAFVLTDHSVLRDKHLPVTLVEDHFNRGVVALSPLSYHRHELLPLVEDRLDCLLSPSRC